MIKAGLLVFKDIFLGHVFRKEFFEFLADLLTSKFAAKSKIIADVISLVLISKVYFFTFKLKCHFSIFFGILIKFFKNIFVFYFYLAEIYFYKRILIRGNKLGKN